MARTLQFTGELSWPLEDGKQAAKMNLAVSLVYSQALYLEKVYAVVATDEALELPMSSAKFLILQALTADIIVKLNGAATGVTLKAGTGFVMIHNPDGAITEITVSTTTVPATLKGYAFA